MCVALLAVLLFFICWSLLLVGGGVWFGWSLLLVFVTCDLWLCGDVCFRKPVGGVFGDVCFHLWTFMGL